MKLPKYVRIQGREIAWKTKKPVGIFVLNWRRIRDNIYSPEDVKLYTDRFQKNQAFGSKLTAPAKSLGRFRSDRENRPAARRRAEKRRFREISPAPIRHGGLGLFSDSEVFRNFVDAFPRGALLAHHFGSVDRFEPAKAFLREEGGTRSVTEGACATLEFNQTLR